LQEFVTRVTNHVPALMRLVEVCVDGGLEATMYSAQAQLADAYIASGSATEAMCLSEDLVAREPWDRANIERFRRALILTGEPEPDALIADRLSGNAPFMSTDLSYVADTDLGGIEASSFEPAAESAASPTAHERSNRAEVDLSVSLDGADGPDATTPDVFTKLRDSSRAAVEAAEHEYERGMTLYEAGQIDDCVQPLQAASYAPRFRFTTGALLGRIFRDSGRADKAVEWFERAAQAPATTAEEGQLLLYDLADALESIGEPVRALAVCLELQAEAGDYRDLAARVDRLTKAQDGG
jgi:tetratricopeptide (TPR) repeat protein